MSILDWGLHSAPTCLLSFSYHFPFSTLLFQNWVKNGMPSSISAFISSSLLLPPSANPHLSCPHLFFPKVQQKQTFLSLQRPPTSQLLPSLDIQLRQILPPPGLHRAAAVIVRMDCMGDKPEFNWYGRFPGLNSIQGQ